ncbi:MAG TPA: K(+)-transporting ATPase subunit C [Terriglobales bacterium]|jgi:K+-transporting ATPase ATPase C chain|nr:K(+)-transporting ATPase subunit C [Terriglobales bacterium]
MKKNLWISISMTVVTTVAFGIIYPMIVTGLAQLIFPHKANGQLIVKDGQVIGSSIIGQGFAGPQYFHSRPSAAGNGYDAGSSGGSNLGPTNQKLLDRVKGDVGAAHAENPGAAVPIDMVTSSASGFDPHITPANAEFQLPRVANARGITIDQLRAVVAKHSQARTFGVLGEARVNVLELNLDLDERFPAGARTRVN